jgi:hypothetical protein
MKTIKEFLSDNQDEIARQNLTQGRPLRQRSALR